MTAEEAVLGRVIGILDALAIPYMVTGSIATSFHGRPRATHDADVVVDLSPDQLEAFVRELDANAFYVSVEAARTALAERRQFNVIETTRATKLDVIIRKDRAFSREEFARRQRVSLPFASPVSIVTPEDAILSKLEWARRAGDSERQLRDAAGVLELNPALDRQYIDRWAVELGGLDLWRRLAAQ